MRKTYTATRDVILGSFSPALNVSVGSAVAFEHMEFLDAEQRDEVAAKLGTGALRPATDADFALAGAETQQIIDAYERDDRDDDGLGWREMFRRYAGIVTYHEGPDHLYERDWTSEEWAAINALDPAAPIPVLDD